ncbi:MAG: four helix bundle protein [Pedobacter sp.]|nr:four helix bundle protein [Pedobacter sp.]MDQ8052810.1 four helix bundle protein [Pedobacter sp.]
MFDIKVRCYQFSKSVIDLLGKTKFNRLYFSIMDQLLRSATSIGANVVEGKAGSSRKDFKNYYTIALKSSNETKYWLCLMRDTNVIDINKEIIKELLDEADQISKILASIIINLNRV